MSFANGPSPAEYSSKTISMEGDSDSEIDEEAVDYGATVEVRVGNIHFKIPVGDGGQSLKWLSLVAAQRYSSYVQAKGRQRQREGRKSQKRGYYKPVDLKLESNKLVRPDTKIRDILTCDKNGKATPLQATVNVELGEEIEVDEAGEPFITPWQEAFVCSEAGKQYFRQKMKTLAPQIDPSLLEQSDDDFFMSAPLFGEFGLPEQYAAEFEIEWSKLVEDLSLRGVFALGDQDEEHSEEKHDFCALFDHYAWFGRGGGKDGEGFPWISFAELKHCIHHTGILDMLDDPATNEDLLVKAFVNSTTFFNEEKTDPDFSQAKIQRHQFIGTLVHLVLLNHSAEELNIQLREIIDSKVTPNGAAIRSASTNTIRQELRNPAVIQLYLENFMTLKDCFEYYCIENNNNMQTMMPQEFLLLFHDSKFDTEFIEKNNCDEKGEEKIEREKESKEQETIMETLNRCKENMTLCQNLGHKHSRTLSDLVFVEFLELLIRSIKQYPLNDDATIQDICIFMFQKIRQTIGDKTLVEDEGDKK